MLLGSSPVMRKSDLEMAYVWSLSSCPNMSTSASGFTSLMCSLRNRQHPPGATGWIVNAADDALPFQVVFVLGKEQVHHEVNDFARRVVLPSCFVGHLRKAAKQVLEDIPHFVIAHHVRMQVHLRELVAHHEEQVIRGQFFLISGPAGSFLRCPGRFSKSRSGRH